MLQVTCLSCGEKIHVQDDQAGVMIRCPRCRTATVVPDRPAPPMAVPMAVPMPAESANPGHAESTGMDERVGRDERRMPSLPAGRQVTPSDSPEPCSPAAPMADAAARLAAETNDPIELTAAPQTPQPSGTVSPPMHLAPGPAGDAGWFYAVAREQYGPVPLATLLAILQAGQIGPRTLVWREGMAQWVTLEQAPELRGAAAAVGAPTGSRSGLATASMIIGIGSAFVWCLHFYVLWLPLTGIVLGALGLRSRRRGQAIAGIILGALWTIACVIVGIATTFLGRFDTSTLGGF